jgi:hypothetical protein
MEKKRQEKLKTILQTSVVVGTFLVTAFYVVTIAIWSWNDKSWAIDILKNHFPATIGLPLSAIAALVVVILLEFTSGPIKFKALGFEFEGAAAPAIIWIFCFLAMTFGIKLIW